MSQLFICSEREEKKKKKKSAELLLVSDRNLLHTHRWQFSESPSECGDTQTAPRSSVLLQSNFPLWVLENGPVCSIYSAAAGDSVCVLCPGQRSVNVQYACFLSHHPNPERRPEENLNPVKHNSIWTGFSGLEMCARCTVKYRSVFFGWFISSCCMLLCVGCWGETDGETLQHPLKFKGRVFSFTSASHTH